MLTLPLESLLIVSLVGAVILAYFPFMWVGYARFRLGYDSHAPRAMFDRLPPYAQRATWAHQNGFEALLIYAIAALSAYVVGVESPWAVGAVLAFLTARLLYSLCYIFDQPILRSLMYATGFSSTLVLLGLSVQQALASA